MNKENRSIKNREIDMLHGSLGDKIFLFAIPLAATMVLQQLFNAADVAVVGRFVGKEAMAAVGGNSPIVGLLINLFVGISLGANVVISSYTGQKNNDGVSKAVHSSIVLALICGVGMAVLGQFFCAPLLGWMGVPDNVMPMSLEYLRIYLIGMPVIILYNFESAIFRSQGDTKTPLICLIIAGIINVILNLFFVIVVGMTASGVALATVIANTVSATLMFILLLRNKGLIRVRLNKLKMDIEILKEILRIGVPAGVQNMVFSLANIVIQSAINSLGSDIMAASSAAFNIEIFAYYVINAFAQANTTFIGQNYGAGNIKRCRRVLKIATLQNMILAIIISFSILFFGKHILAIFNDDPTVIKYGYIRMFFILACEPINVMMESFSGALRGYRHSLEPAILALLGICGTRVIWVYTVFRLQKNYTTLMICFPLSWTITGTMIIICYFILRKKIEQNVNEINNSPQSELV